MTDGYKPVAPERARRKNDSWIFTPEQEAELRETFNYNPETGEFTWKKAPKRYKKAKVGDIAGTINKTRHGDRTLRFAGKQIKAHRVAFFLMMGRWPNPGMMLDHRDCNPSNNRWRNIREATSQENQRNRKTPITNKIGFKGVFYLKQKGIVRRFQARLKLNQKVIYLGTYLTPEEASDAYLSAILFLHGEFANLD